MKAILYIIIAFFFFVSCKKKKVECGERTCLGKLSFNVSKVKNLALSKDTLFIFKSLSGDSLKLKFRKSFLQYQKTYYGCMCVGEDTDITDESYYGTYVFQNSSFGCSYLIRTYGMADVYEFSILFSDTLGSSISPSSQFQIVDISKKENDLDSLNINGKYYHSIIKSYDNVRLVNNATITECFYSKYFGIVRLKYNNTYYDILN